MSMTKTISFHGVAIRILLEAGATPDLEDLQVKKGA
jgi:hypothetical protein